jgi:inner membrane protein YidH
MIRGYSDHAANERTFLAWVRTGIAVVAFGFVVEKFNLFMATTAGSALGEDVRRVHLARLSGPFGHYDGLALIFGGIAIIVLSTARFIRTTRRLDDPEEHSAKSVRAELFMAAGLVLLVVSYSFYLALD